MARTTARELNGPVASLLTDVRTAAIEASEFDLVTTLNAEVELWGADETTVVIVGEENGGKTTLFNALLGTGDLLPADALRHSSLYVVARRGEESMALVHLDKRPQPIRIELADVARWVGSDVEDGSGVRGLEVRLPSPLLESGLVLVDTPGVGGLDSERRRVTLAAIRRADALLLVTDASAPLGTPELDFLRDATARVGSVFVAVTKTDAYRGWRRIVDDDRHLLAEHAPEALAVEFVAVSAHTHNLAAELAAAGTPDPDLEHSSGIHLLGERLTTRVSGRGALLRLANLLRVADSVVARLFEAPAAAVAASTGAPEAQALLEQEQSALEALREAAESTHVMVSDRFNSLRDLVNTDLVNRVRVIGDRFETDPKLAAAGPKELTTTLETELQVLDTELGEIIEEHATRILSESVELLDAEELDVQIAVRAGLADLNPTAKGSSSAMQDPSARVRIMSALTSSGMTAGYAQLQWQAQHHAMAVLMGGGVLIGIAATVAGARFGKRQRDLQAARAAVRGALDQCRSEASPRLRQAILEVQRELEAGVRSYVRQRTRAHQKSLTVAQDALRADVSARQRTWAEASQRMARLAELRQRATRLRSEVAAVIEARG